MLCAKCGLIQELNNKVCALCGMENMSVPAAQTEIALQKQLDALLSGVQMKALLAVRAKLQMPLNKARQITHGIKKPKQILTTIWYVLLVLILGEILTISTIDPVFEDNPETLISSYQEMQADGMDMASDAIYISTDQLASNLREEFAYRHNVRHTEPLLNLRRNHEFSINLEFIVDWEEVNDMFAVYMDADLTNRLDVDFRILKDSDDPSIPEGHSRLLISPGLIPVGRVLGFFNMFNYDIDNPGNSTFERVYLPGSDGFYLSRTEPGENWGYLNQFYLVMRVNSIGDLLNIPHVTIFTIRNELEAPQSEFFITEQGLGGFRWNEIEGADYYLVVRVDEDFTERSIISPIAKVTETSWVHPYDSLHAMNYEFLTVGGARYNYSVIAVNSRTHSAFGIIHDGREISARLLFDEEHAISELTDPEDEVGDDVENEVGDELEDDVENDVGDEAEDVVENDVENDVVDEADDEEDDEADDEVVEILYRPYDRVNASSPLSAFLARNMLVVNENIDLSEFPESADWDYLTAAFFEALSQNPLILHVEEANRVPGSDIFRVEYRESAETIFAQQEALRRAVPEIISSIITPNMSESEKSQAINDFLAHAVEYDWAALEDAERNNFQTFDARFNNSINAYGVLINRLGICAGNAAAFKLLADEVGLTSTVVIEPSDGLFLRAWNHVSIDEQLPIIDVVDENDVEFDNMLTSGCAELDAMFDAAGRQYNINPDLLRAVAQVESNFRANATSHAGARGIMQIMPATARHLGVTDPFDPLQSIMGGARYLREQLDRFNGDIQLALAAYNAGWPAVRRHGGIPPFRETRAYVSRVLNLFGDGDITAGIHAYSNTRTPG